MFLNIRWYYMKYLNPNNLLYVEVRNNCPYYLYMSIEYDIDHSVIKKQSPVFGPDNFQRLTFSSNASIVYLRIFNCSQLPPEIICSQIVKNYMSSCYDVTGQSIGNISYVEVPC